MDEKELPKTIEEELKRAKEELETQAWGMAKTNEAIKVLYRELERKNKELQQLDNMKSEFLNSVSHELRSPLTTIREAIAQILEGLFGEVNPDQKKFLSICLENADRLRRMIDNLLDMSRLEAGKFKMMPEEIDIVSVAKEVVVTFSSRLKGRNLEIKERYPSGKALVYADKDSIAQVLTNLVSNALKFTQKGYIEITIEEKADYIECSVSDTGRGISDEDLPKVFGKFQQFGLKSNSGEKGTGLGLSICKSIVELHYGKIWVESKLNQGTKFTFTIPKYTGYGLYKKYIGEELNKAIKNRAFLSIVAVALKGFDTLVSKFGSERAKAVLQDLEHLIRRDIPEQAHAVFKANAVIIAVLPEAEKQRALEISKIIQGITNNYISAENLDIKTEIKVVNYPEDAITQEQIDRYLGVEAA